MIKYGESKLRYVIGWHAPNDQQCNANCTKNSRRLEEPTIMPIKTWSNMTAEEKMEALRSDVNDALDGLDAVRRENEGIKQAITSLHEGQQALAVKLFELAKKVGG
jgi:hypothetical protein